MRRASLIICAMSLVNVWGQQPAPSNFSGTWREQSGNAVQFVVEQKDNSIHIKELKGTDTIADYTCNTVGKECDVKYQGHPANTRMDNIAVLDLRHHNHRAFGHY